MKELTLWKDEQFRQMRDDLDRLFREFLGDFAAPGLILAGEPELPRIELSEDKEAVLVKMAYPGLDPGDLEISVSPEVLIIKAAHQEKLGNAAGEVRRQFSQQIKLPCRVEPEKAEALCFDHRLEIRLPKSRKAVFRNIALRRVRK